MRVTAYSEVWKERKVGSSVSYRDLSILFSTTDKHRKANQQDGAGPYTAFHPVAAEHIFFPNYHKHLLWPTSWAMEQNLTNLKEKRTIHAHQRHMVGVWRHHRIRRDNYGLLYTHKISNFNDSKSRKKSSNMKPVT